MYPDIIGEKNMFTCILNNPDVLMDSNQQPRMGRMKAQTSQC